MKSRKYFWARRFLYLSALPWNLFVWLIVVIIRFFWGTKLWWSEGSLWTELAPNSWPCMTWYRYKEYGRAQKNPKELRSSRGLWRTWGGTTLGHGGWYGPGKTKGVEVDTMLEFHEHIHVEQFEVFSLLGFVVALITWIVLLFYGSTLVALSLSLGIWTFMAPLAFSCGWFVALLRGESAYKGSVHEEHAYSEAYDIYTNHLKNQ